MTLYCLNCADGYIRAADEGYTVVGLHKASVYEDIEGIKKLAKKIGELPGLRGIEMTLTEKEIKL